MTNLKNKSRKLKRSLKIKRRLRGGDCKGVVRNNDPTFWPINSGCVADSGTIVRLQVGTIIDRFGDADGRTFSPVAGVPHAYEARAMPFMKMGDFRTQSNCNNEYIDYAQQNYRQYKVIRPFVVYRCVVNDFQYNNDPEQSYEGGAIQYTLTANSIPNAEKSKIPGFRNTDAPNVADMLHLEYLERVVPDRIPQFRIPFAVPYPNQGPNPNPNPNANPIPIPYPNANPIAIPYHNPGPVAVPYHNPGPIPIPYHNPGPIPIPYPNPNPNANPNPNPNANPNPNPNANPPNPNANPPNPNANPNANPNPNPPNPNPPNPNPNENLFNHYNNPYTMASMWGGGKRRRSVKRKRNNKRFT